MRVEKYSQILFVTNSTVWAPWYHLPRKWKPTFNKWGVLDIPYPKDPSLGYQNAIWTMGEKMRDKGWHTDFAIQKTIWDTRAGYNLVIILSCIKLENETTLPDLPVSRDTCRHNTFVWTTCKQCNKSTSAIERGEDVIPKDILY